MIFHIFSDSPYTYRFIKFVNKTWEPCNHEFIILMKEGSRFGDYYKKTENCHPISRRFRFFQYANLFFKAQKVIFHQLNHPRLFLTLSLLYPSVFHKCIWSMWGADVYFHKNKTNSLKDNVIDNIMRHTIAKLPVITGYIPGDFEIVKSHYRCNAIYIQSKYPSPVDIESIKAITVNQKKQGASTTIMVGNSADPSNGHIDAFAQLSKYRNEKIKILSVLSYGGSHKYIHSVIESGRRIFGKNFIPVTDYLSFEDYLNLISSVDILFFNHKRQQGFGNLIIFFALEKKVFISCNVTPYDYYKSIGISLFAIEKIQNMSFSEFVQVDTYDMQRNRAIILKEINLTNIKNQWNCVFNA